MNSKKLNTINIVLVITLGAVLTIFNLNYRLDDALIYFRYIENFINGNGLVYNIGEKFNALTSPLYVYVSILVSSVTREVEISQMVLNGILLICTVITTVYIFKEFKMDLAGFIVSLLLVTAKYFYQVFGMETNLFLLLTLLTILFYLKGKYTTLSITGALLILTRGEGLFLVLAITYFIYREHKEVLKLKLLIPTVVLLLLNLLFNYVYYGRLLPHTLMAKIYQGQSGMWGAASFVTNVDYLFDMFNRQPFYIILLFIFAASGLIKYHNNRFVFILILFAILSTAFYSAFNIPNYHWYYSIHFLLLFVLAGLGISSFIEYLKSIPKLPVIYKILIILLFTFFGLTQLEIARWIIREKPNSNYKYIGKWFKNNTPPDTKIAAVEIGHIGWYSKRYIIDILGLTNEHNAELIANGDYKKWFDYYEPDYIVMHDPYWPVYERSLPYLIEHGYYAVDSTFNLRDFKILKSTVKK